MKKTFNAPEIVELDFSETSNVTCGVKGRRVITGTSGCGQKLTFGNCFNVTTLFGNDGSFDDDIEVSFDFDESED